MPSRPRSRGCRSTQSWATFLRNHAGAILACDFFIVVTATFQQLYVFVILDIGTRRVVHWNLTEHPTAEWTIQQFRNGLPLDGASRFLVHDRDGILRAGRGRGPSVDVARGVEDTGAGAASERALRTLHWDGQARVSRLDDPTQRAASPAGLGGVAPHYNGERPHSALGPGLPDESTRRTTLTGHRLPAAHRVVASTRLGGLHHHYQLEPIAA
jgi:hypothetical protein